MNYRNKTTGSISTQGEIRQANKHRSFPRVWDADVCTLLDIDPILAAPKPASTSLQAVNANGAVQDALGNWVEAWVVVDAFSDTTDEDGVVTTKAANEASYLAGLDATAAASVRAERNKLLAATDWVVLRAKELGQAVPIDYYEYRGDLRQVPEQAGFPDTITWPTSPQVWSTPLEVYPVHVSPSQAPVGTVLVAEPQVVRQVDYLPVQSAKAPYGLQQEYSRRLWVC